jgi:hypothetical protein
MVYLKTHVMVTESGSGSLPTKRQTATEPMYSYMICVVPFVFDCTIKGHFLFAASVSELV